MKTLSDILRRRRGRIINQWRENVLADPLIPRANSLRHPALEDNVPQLLDEIIVALDRGQHAAADGRVLASAVMPREHAQIRFAQNYTLASTLRELSHLREAVIEAYWSDGAVDHRSIRLVHAALDECMAVAAANMEELVSLALKADRERLQGEVEVRERFATTLNEDMRAPLEAARMAARSLEQGASSEQADLVTRVVRATDRMHTLINGLLDFARLRGGSMTLEKQHCDLAKVCADVVAELQGANPERTIDVETIGNLVGRWDPARLSQVMVNLLGNALSYSPPESIVRVIVREIDSGVRVDVHNLGDPIPVATQTKLFEPFERGNHTGTGIGLGLFIAREMVFAHGGSIRLLSDAEHGTTFTVHLPRP